MSDALAAARDLPPGPDKVAELDAVVTAADRAGDVRLGFEARLDLIDACLDAAEPARVLGLFAWCRAAADREPMLFTDTELALLRYYHLWAVGTFRASPGVGLAETQALLADLERRFEQDKRPLFATHRLRAEIADHLGDLAAARDWLARCDAELPAVPDADFFTDGQAGDTGFCPSCYLADRAFLHAAWGDWAAAVEAAEPVLRVEASCPEQPDRALAALMIPYLRLGRFDEAAQAHLRSYRRHRLDRASFPLLADHLRFCALAGLAGRGVDLLETHLGDLDDPYDELSAMRFAAAGTLVCRRATAEGLGDRRLHRPTHGDRPAADVTVRELGTVLASVAATLAARFDARNGTDHQSRLVGDWLAELPVVTSGAIRLDDAPLGPLTLEALVEALDARGDHYAVDEDGLVGGRWPGAYIQFERLGERREILQVRVVAERRLPASRLIEAYEFCNAWNHDKLMPKAYVHDTGEGELLLAGEVTTDLEYGATAGQLATLVNAAIATGTTFAAAVADLPT
ncbi:YbjN domain-containing protein [Asanoa sp. WMMD1127]|uniref:YbjN domain-containing protein n=1 Tax=Asanoa sp. WMMD1127 TaxID=3016107 RepID=UPI0024169FF3|nr:YbjN domain-containing protein [Asanoa sp. WMMD1127]MDG4823682.1 YbjN domain-containing protein [Asanoa sp. WMMD1127]